MYANDSGNFAPMPPPQCRLSSPVPTFVRDCVWLLNYSISDGSENAAPVGLTEKTSEAMSHKVPHYLSFTLGAANALGIAVAVCVYAALVRRRCYPTYNLMLLLLCALDLLHQASSAASDWLDWDGRTSAGVLVSGDGRQVRAGQQIPVWHFQAEWRMRAGFSAAAWLRLLSFAAYPCRNYWVAYICTFRCRLIWHPATGGVDAPGPDDAAGGGGGIRRQLGLLCARAGAIFLAACALVGLWQAASGGTDTVCHCPGDRLSLQSHSGETVRLNGSGVYATMVPKEFACGEQLNTALRASHFVLSCLLPIVVVLMGTCLSIRGLRRSNFSAGRYGRARRLLAFTCGAFVCLEVPYAVTGLMDMAYSHPGEQLGIAMEASQLLCSFNSTVILCLNALSNRAIWQQAALVMHRAAACCLGNGLRNGRDSGDGGAAVSEGRVSGGISLEQRQSQVNRAPLLSTSSSRSVARDEDEI